jgi:S-ribosylhomocysteine lyase LuxS involved in autoinducer biosynthesis
MDLVKRNFNRLLVTWKIQASFIAFSIYKIVAIVDERPFGCQQGFVVALLYWRSLKGMG